MSKGEFSWRRVAKGINLTGFGVFLLLTTLDVLPWSYWAELLSYWPVLLIVAGVYLVFDRSRAPWLALLSPVVFLGTMTLVALDLPRPILGPGSRIEAVRPEGASEWRLEGELAMVDLDLRAQPIAADRLLEGEVAGTGRRPVVLVSGSDEQPRVRLRNWSMKGFWPGRRPAGRVEAGLAADLPLTVDLDLAMVDGVIDLSAAEVSRIRTDGAFQDLTLRLGAPASDVRVTLRGAFNRIALEVPAGVPVSVDAEGFMNPVSGRDRPPTAGPGYDVRLEGAFNWIAVRPDVLERTGAEAPE